MPEAAGERDRFIHRHAPNGYERDDVHGTDPRVAPAVFSHVDAFQGLPAGGAGRPDHRLRRPEKGDHGPVVVGIPAFVHDPDAPGGFQGFRDPAEDGLVPALAEIGNTF